MRRDESRSENEPPVDRVQASYDRWVGFAFGALLGVVGGLYLAAREGWPEWWQLWVAVAGLGAVFGASAAHFGRAFWDAVSGSARCLWLRL